MHVDIVSLLIRTGLDLTKRGDKYTALCPLHDDKNTPSFIVYPQTDTWTCFSSNCNNPKSNKRNGGNGIDFVMQRYGYDYYEANKWINEQFTSNYEPIVFIKSQKKSH